MAMATRLRIKKREENNEPMKMMEKAPTTKATMDVKDKRRAFGDIYNKLGSSSASSLSQEKPIEKPKAGQAGYKDIKPRVDTRWKKAEVPGSRVGLTTSQSSSSLITTKMTTTAKPLPKPKLMSVTESIAIQLKRTTKLTSLVDMKKTSLVKKDSVNSNDMILIKSPGSFKLKREKSENVQKNFYESHSSKLIHQVEDIDQNDAENPQLLAEYVNDIYSYLFKLERKFTIRENFLQTQMDVTPKMRSVLLDWLNEVHNQFSLEPETFHMAVSMIDRYLQANTTTPRRYLQLVGVTALFTAAKYEELMPPEITDFVYVTDDTYSKEQILQMERRIFQALNYNLSKPLSIHFLRRFIKAAGQLGDRHYLTCKYFLELASIDYELSKYNPSEIAGACLYLTLYIFNTIKSDDGLWTPTLQYYSTYTTDDLMPVIKRLATIVSTAKEVKLKAVFVKYSHAVYKFTSSLPEMNGVKMQEILSRN